MIRSFKSGCLIHAKYISDKVTPFNLWILFFSHSLICGVFFYEVVIPNISSLHAPNTSLTPDSTSFNQAAIKLADGINQHGWQFWKLYPEVGASGQSSYLAILYVFFGAHLVYAVLFNAFFHAIFGVLIYLIALEILCVNHFSGYVTFLSASLFVVFPSAIAAIVMMVHYVLKGHLKLAESIFILITWLVFVIILIRLKIDGFLMLLEKLN